MATPAVPGLPGADLGLVLQLDKTSLWALAILPESPLDFTGVLSAWDSGDPRIRRNLLPGLFDALNVEDGAIVAYLPRADRATDVVTLLRYVPSGAGAGRSQHY